MIARLLATGLLAALAGCTGRLEVVVDVMNPAYLRAATAEMAFVNDANDLASGASVRADRVLLASETELAQFGNRCLRGVLEQQQNALPGAVAGQQASIQRNIGVATTSLAELPTRIRTFQAPWRPRLRAADAAARAAVLRDLPQLTGLAVWQPPAGGRLPRGPRTAAAVPPAGDRRAAGAWPLAVPDSVKTALAERQVHYDAYSAAVAGEITAVGAICDGAAPPALKPAVSQAVTAAKVKAGELASVVGGGTLLNHMTEAFFAANADETAWAHAYNRAIGEGYNGDVSVALVMNDTADFSVKGMVFDGRSTAEMVTKLATQTITTIAAAYGAPFMLGSRKDDGTTSSPTYDGSRDLSAAESAIAEAGERERAWRAGLLAIATSVTTDFDALANGDTTAVARTGAVVQTYTGGP